MGEKGGFNLYAYCANDPVNRHDALGLDYYGNYYGDEVAFDIFQRKNPLSTADPCFAAKSAEYDRLDFRAARAMVKMQEMAEATDLYNEYARLFHWKVPVLSPYEWDDESSFGKGLLFNLKLKGVIKAEELILAMLPIGELAGVEGAFAAVGETAEIPTGGKIFTGAGFGRPRKSLQEIADEGYAQIRRAGLADVAAVAENSGLTLEEARTMKKHLFFGTHRLFDPDAVRGWVRMRFTPDDQIAYAWQYAVENELTQRQKQWFRELADHELTERKFMGQGIPYRNPDGWDPVKEMFLADPPGAHDLAPMAPKFTFPGYNPKF